MMVSALLLVLTSQEAFSSDNWWERSHIGPELSPLH